MRVKERIRFLEIELSVVEDEIQRLERAGDYGSDEYNSLCEEAAILEQDLDAMRILDEDDEY